MCAACKSTMLRPECLFERRRNTITSSRPLSKACTRKVDLLSSSVVVCCRVNTLKEPWWFGQNIYCKSMVVGSLGSRWNLPSPAAVRGKVSGFSPADSKSMLGFAPTVHPISYVAFRGRGWGCGHPPPRQQFLQRKLIGAYAYAGFCSGVFN